MKSKAQLTDKLTRVARKRATDFAKIYNMMDDIDCSDDTIIEAFKDVPENIISTIRWRHTKDKTKSKKQLFIDDYNRGYTTEQLENKYGKFDAEWVLIDCIVELAFDKFIIQVDEEVKNE